MKKSKTTLKRHKYFEFGGLQVIGDCVAFSLAQLLNLPSFFVGKSLSIRHSFSTFDVITPEYLLAHISMLEKVNQFVMLSIGFSDQSADVTFDPLKFEECFEGILRELRKKGAWVVIAIMPPPHPRCASVGKVKNYVALREVIEHKFTFTGLSYTAVDTDDLVLYTMSKVSLGVMKMDWKYL